MQHRSGGEPAYQGYAVRPLARARSPASVPGVTSWVAARSRARGRVLRLFS
ncbi:MAG: hypothetical protein ACOYBY_04220 [Dermatophilaceae bacterium]